MKEIIAVGTTKEIVSHLEGKGLSVRQTIGRDYDSAVESAEDVGAILLQWDGMSGHAARILDARRNAKNKNAKVPVFLIWVQETEVDQKVADLAKKARVDSIYSYPKEVFKLDMALFDFVPQEEDEVEFTAPTVLDYETCPYQPSKKYTVNDVLTLSAKEVAAQSSPAPRSKRVYFYSEKTDLADQAQGLLSKFTNLHSKCFSSAADLLDAVYAEPPGYLLLFCEANVAPFCQILEKIMLNRKLPFFGIELMFPGETSRNQFLRSAQGLLFDQVTITGLTAKSLQESIQNLAKIGSDESSARKLLLRARALLGAKDVNHSSVDELLNTLSAMPGKARIARREAYFQIVSRGDANAALAQLDAYAAEFPDDVEMWFSMRQLLVSRKMNALSCVEKCFAVLSRGDIFTDTDHRLLLKAIEEEGRADLLKTYISIREENQKHPDNAMKLAFSALAASMKDTATETQWLLELLSAQPTDPGLLMRLGKALDTSSDFASSGKVYMIGAKAAPKSRIPFELKYVESLANEGRKMRAEEKLSSLQNEFPGDPRILRLAKKLGLIVTSEAPKTLAG